VLGQLLLPPPYCPRLELPPAAKELDGGEKAARALREAAEGLFRLPLTRLPSASELCPPSVWRPAGLASEGGLSSMVCSARGAAEAVKEGPLSRLTIGACDVYRPRASSDVAEGFACIAVM
jgi:hypothetical protein